MKVLFADLFIITMQICNFASMSDIGKANSFPSFVMAGYILAIFFILCKYMKKLMSGQKYLLYIALVGLVTIVVFNSMGREFAITIAYWFALREENIDEMLKTFLKVNVFCFSINVLLSIFGFYNMFYTGRSGLKILSLGFQNPNSLGLFLFSCVTIVLLLNDIGKWKTVFLEIIIGSICIFFVHCRSAGGALLIMAFATLVYDSVKSSKIFKIVLTVLFPVLSLFSIVFALHGGKYTSLNYFLSGRLGTWEYYWNTMPINVFGNWFYTAKLLALDNFYLYALFRYGLIVLAIYTLANILLARKCYKRINNNFAISYIAFCLYALMENGPMTCYMNVLLAVLTTEWGSEHDETNTIKQLAETDI